MILLEQMLTSSSDKKIATDRQNDRQADGRIKRQADSNNKTETKLNYSNKYLLRVFSLTAFKDHLLYETTFIISFGWSLYTGNTVQHGILGLPSTQDVLCNENI